MVRDGIPEAVVYGKGRDVGYDSDGKRLLRVDVGPIPLPRRRFAPGGRNTQRPAAILMSSTLSSFSHEKSGRPKCPYTEAALKTGWVRPSDEMMEAGRKS